MILQVGDDGVVSEVNEDDLIYVDKNELDAFVEEYNHLKEEKEQQQKSFDELAHNWKIMYDEAKQVISDLEKENKELKERNNRQAKQLDNLYTLIEKQDWKTLKGIIQEFQECEEQLQREWKCYE